MAERVRGLIRELQAQGKLPGASVIPQDTAAAILNSLPADASNDLYWHGEDARPCPCAQCVAAAARFLIAAGLLDAIPVRKAS